MLSLPLIIPHDDLWQSSTNRQPSFAPPTDVTNSQNNPLNQSQAQANRRTALNAPSFRSQLALLTEDEKAIEQRKQNVRRFGAAWLRPPGVAKTFQARMDEEQERAEQAEMARREAQMLEMAAAAEADIAGADGEGEGEGDEEEERDLDAEVPEAEGIAEDGSDEGSEVDVTFNEESLMEGSVDGGGREMLELEDAELAGTLQDERDLGFERDLDDSVPEAGSYQHTDTELEDESSESGDDDDEEAFLAARATNMMRGGRVGGSGESRFFRQSMESQHSQMIASSSLMGSSPATGRAPTQRNLFNNRVLGRRSRGQ